MKEYKGEPIAARLKARLIPPNEQYADNICELILTHRHLYILEDNFDGTYNTLFMLFIERIRDMEAQVKGRRYKRSALYEMIISGCLSLMGGIIYYSGKKPDDDGIRFVITSNDSAGKCNRLYFKDLQSNSKRFIKAFHKLKHASGGEHHAGSH